MRKSVKTLSKLLIVTVLMTLFFIGSNHSTVRAVESQIGMTAGYLASDTNPEIGAIGNWGFSSGVAVDYQDNSVGIDLGSSRSVNRIELWDTDTSTRCTEYNYVLYWSNDNSSYTQISGWGFSERIVGSQRVHSFQFTGITARYIKIHTTYGDAAYTFVLSPFQSNVKVFGGLGLTAGYLASDTSPETGAIGNWGFSSGVAVDYQDNSVGIDLGSSRCVNKIELWDTNASTRCIESNYVLYWSNDNSNYTQISGWVFNERIEGSQIVHSFEFTGITARYIKIHTTYSDAAYTFVLNPFQSSVKAFEPTLTAGYLAGDTSPETGAIGNWGFSSGVAVDYQNNSVGIDLGNSRSVKRVELWDTNASTRCTGSDYVLYWSNDNLNYTQIPDWVFNERISGSQIVHSFEFTGITARYIKIHTTYSDSAFTFVLNPFQSSVKAFDVLANYYVSPTGNDSNPGTLTLPFQTIGKARDVVRTINGNMMEDINIYLRGGTYTLSSPLMLNQNDSGTNGYNVIYQNYQNEIPVISGGTTITGWTRHSGNIYKASVPSSLNTRQLYVNGKRATRARSTGDLAGVALWGDAGFSTTDTSMKNWGNQSDIEVVFEWRWTHSRIGVSSISGDASRSYLTMKQPAFGLFMSYYKDVWLTAVKNEYIENAYELLDQPGEWYLDRTAHMIYYIPLPGEDMSTATVVAPVLETLVSGSGTISTPVHNIQFQGITFSYATWMGVNRNEGYTNIQADYCLDGTGDNIYNWLKTPANVTFDYAKNILFKRDKFLHLGGAGLGFQLGCQSNTVLGNEFTDISASNIQLGGITQEDFHPSDQRNIIKDNTISNNFVHDSVVEYKGSVGIFVGYAENTLIEHNEICNLPYSGISIGWGWGGTDWYIRPPLAKNSSELWKLDANDPTTSKNNKIISNHIHHIMEYLYDGGGIYVLGAQPGMLISGNVVHDQYGIIGELPAAIYLDIGCRYVTISNNITYSNLNDYLIHDGVNSNSIEYDHDFEFNYWDTEPSPLWQFSSTITYKTQIGNGNVPSSILDNAGLQAAYIDLLPSPSVNLALGKVANAYYVDGSPATMDTGNEAYKAIDGDKEPVIDGDAATMAQATGQYAWIEEVDLGNTYNISRVRIRFGDNNYATDYSIQTSLTGGQGNFTTVKTVTGCTGGTSDQSFSATNARYVRIQAIKPDGAGQTGVRMGIAELEVFGMPNFTPSPTPTDPPVVVPDLNIAINKKAAAYNIDGSPATMLSGHEADKATNSNLSDWAQANGQYAWIEEVDLDDIYNINQVEVDFLPDLYASEYEIQTSIAGGQGNFTTVKTVTGCTGGSSIQNFSPVSARFIRIKAIKPDGPNQTGGQMAIRQIKAKEYKNLASRKPASAFWIDGTPATMSPYKGPDKAVDGDRTTYACAYGQWRWIEQVDLGAIYNVNQVGVTFMENYYATEYDIQVSTTGTEGSFTTVASITGSTGSGGGLTTFDPVSARYVRIKANKPDGPDQKGIQMCIAEIQVFGVNHALKTSRMTDSTAGNDKYYYQRISEQPFTFQAGDIIKYDVKLLTNLPNIGGIDIINFDGTRFKDVDWFDQNNISGRTTNVDLTAKANNEWYTRWLTVPAAMVGKTSRYWELGFENDSPSTLFQAMYDNIYVIRGGNIVLTIYKNNYPDTYVAATEFAEHYLIPNDVNAHLAPKVGRY